MSKTPPPDNDLTLVLDIGKSHAKLVLIDAAGEVVARQVQPNQSAPGPGYTALGVPALEAWLLATIPELPRRRAIRRLSITTHGAAFCGIDDAEGLVLPPMDYEWDGYGDTRAEWQALADPFEETGTPFLPMGLNAGLQLHWLQRHHGEACARVQHWLPYPQYWAWWFSGVACSEVSSLGCHTGLWSPTKADFSPWAHRSGLAARFAPIRRAWEAIGTLRPALAQRLDLPPDIQVMAGSHDSNACLARYLRSDPNALVLSTGTWCVLMAPGASVEGLDATRDELVNVAVDGRPVPTARFMGGREFAVLCGEASPALATAEALAEVMREGWKAVPAFAAAGGPFPGQRGQVFKRGVETTIDAVPHKLRPALASLYCAEIIAAMVQRLDPRAAANNLLLEGPLASNAAFRTALVNFIAPRNLTISQDELEGTARGAWLLALPRTAKPGLKS
ncbi:L-fuculose kinase [Ideonella azotifigens]|uniref:FGGY-family carbohydrate kinase n=1 Tax=Ideonella azotifigens TaxID=513160 RepID=A0ABN1KFF1_9BURK|nr:FGGY family carbohydrate kinase [Ideonella azotifigens]MCD2340578.1 L-fuculose kinase [Ideonella azotifigens]